MTTVMQTLVPLTVTNRGGDPLLVKGGEGGDKTVDSLQTLDTHSPAAVLAMVDSVQAEVQAQVETKQA